MGRGRHVPTRMCAGCGGRFAKGSLVRFTVQVREDRRELALDAEGTVQSRGAYVCPRTECFERALTRKTLARRLGATSEQPLLGELFAREISGRKP